MAHANKQRGEVKIEGPDEQEFKLCLTLGAIEQIEDQLGLESLANIDEVFGENPSMKHINTILIALLNGGGHTEITRKDLMAWPLDMTQLLEKIREAFKAAGFGDDDEEDGEGGEVPPKK